MTAPLRRLAVVGAGSMGAQIAQQAALRGIDVRLQDTSEEQLRKAVESNRGHLLRRVEKGRLSAEAAEAAIGRVRTTTDLAEAAHDADLIIEAVFGDLGVKRRRRTGCWTPEWRASRTSTSRSRKGSTGRWGRFGWATSAGSTSRTRVEVVRGRETSDETVEKALAAARAMDRTPVLINKEIDGFIVNRILHAATQEAYRLLDAGVAGFEDIDLGPFRLGDFSGLDVTYKARRHMFESTGDERYRPSPQLEAKVKAGKLGRKTKEGWYKY